MPSCHWFGRKDAHCNYAPDDAEYPEGMYCPRDCLGDFTEAARILAPKTRLRRAYVEDRPRRRPGTVLLSKQAGKEWSFVGWIGRRKTLGICELHGNIDLVGLFDGKLYVEETVSWPPDTWGP